MLLQSSSSVDPRVSSSGRRRLNTPEQSVVSLSTSGERQRAKDSPSCLFPLYKAMSGEMIIGTAAGSCRTRAVKREACLTTGGTKGIWNFFGGVPWSTSFELHTRGGNSRG